MWEGREVEDGQRWQTDLNTVCTCTSGKVTCQSNIKGKNQLPSDSSFSASFPLTFLLLTLSHTYKKHTQYYRSLVFDTLGISEH